MQKQSLLFIGLSLLAACSGTGGTGDGSGDSGVTLSADDSGSGEGSADSVSASGDEETGNGCPADGCLDVPDTDTGPQACTGDGMCDVIDVLFVIDNSGTMGEEQLNLAANFPLLVDKLQALTDASMAPIDPDVNIMVTTTDMGHPSCTPFQPDGYMPAQGSPVKTACFNRLADFTGLGQNPPVYEEACTNGCPVPVEPIDPFIHFDSDFTNVPGDNVKGALSCIGPQGINGCGYEAQLESMLQALNPGADWNQGSKPFLRDGSILAIVHVTDEVECSVRAPDGYSFFTDSDNDVYWETNPNSGEKTQATSAVCWNSGVTCEGPDMDGIYTNCHSEDKGVLHPTTRYIDYLKGELQGSGREVIMLGILGVPPVTAHNPAPPYEPTAGGLADLVYRDWRDGQFPAGDILPGDSADGPEKQWEFGIGPGCTGEDGMGGYTGQAMPNTRVVEVCESLNKEDQIRCCIESICDTDFSEAINCLTGVIQNTIVPPG